MKSIKEKAEAYDKVLEWATEAHKVCDGMLKEDLEHLFPELIESEDEKIRIDLINYFNGAALEHREEEVLAWLEKQGTSYTKRDVDDAYLEGVTFAKNEIDKQYEANYQIRKDIATFIFNYRGDIKDRAKWMDYLGIKVSFTEKQGEQKPVIEMKSAEESLGIDSDTYTKIVDECIFGEQNPVWSEEDEKMIQDIINDIAIAQEQVYCKSRCEEEIDWLKSLRPQNTWKPSDEQMDAINDAIDYLGGNTKIVRKHLMSLYEQLKKLKA